MFWNQKSEPVPSGYIIQIPILNQKCPRNAKNACADMTFPPAVKSEVLTVVFEPAVKPNLVFVNEDDKTSF